MNNLSPPSERPHRSHATGHEDSSKRPALERSPHPYLRRSSTLVLDDSQKSSPATSQQASRSESTESGTEADDEKGQLLRGLPAPPLRSHKGLRGSTPRGLSPLPSPLPTPPANSEAVFFQNEGDQHTRDRSKERKKQKEYHERKRAELVRRTTEVILLLAICILIWRSVGGLNELRPWLAELSLSALATTTLYFLYPLRRTQLAYSSGRTLLSSLRIGFYIPSRFDPGPLLYPVVLPTTIALSLYRQNPSYVPLGIICGLASIPEAATSIYPDITLSWHLRWLISLIPLSPTVQIRVLGIETVPISLKASSAVQREDLSLIFPLHQALRATLNFLTTTSLDPTELDLLASALIYLLIFAHSPQAQILKAILWVGGLSTFVTCRYLLAWEVELARIPRWKFARVPHRSALSHRLQRAFSAFMSEPIPTSESSDDEIDTRAKPLPRSLQRVRTLADSVSGSKASLVRISTNGDVRSPRRRNTISDLDPTTRKAAQKRSHRNRDVQSSQFLSLTLQQAKIRKYLYAAVVYALVLAIIAGPARHYCDLRALHGYESFGWAIGYLFGDIPSFRHYSQDSKLASWIAQPRTPFTSAEFSPQSLLDLLALLRRPANTRLVLVAYCLIVILSGIVVVLQLTAYVEVDTRRKVFHGVMVVMLLPTIFVDPCFFSLALILVLALFLLLDLFRSSQLPPISRPLTNFLAPYVDGRDHRGPVIVSHIFLLIGCAIPLWLSLAGLPRTGDDPWRGWDVPTRDLSMIAGVVCVGMGDAAASLIGRRFGRTKWYWGGGKSLEGSVAFAAAVTLGLAFGWVWLRLWGWVPAGKEGNNVNLREAGVALVKCAVAACGASLLESVLTAANDNVVVPIGLWLLVRGLQI